MSSTKEAKMLKLAGVVLGLLATSAFAADVNWKLISPNEGAQYPANAVPDIVWQAAVDVKSSEPATVNDPPQGLAAYVATVEITDASSALLPVTLSLADFAFSFDNGGRATIVYGSPTSVDDSGGNGGAGMAGVLSTGSNATPGRVNGFGAGYGPWSSPYNPATKKGTTVWGVGLADRKATLLNNADAEYILNGGTIPGAALTALNLPIGVYTVTIVAQSANVIKPGLDMNVAQAGSFAVPADNILGDSFTFEIIPEPATALLLAGAALLYRRRRTA